MNRGQPLLFTGAVVSQEQNRWNISSERSLRGPMEFTLDGRDRLHLTWNRR